MNDPRLITRCPVGCTAPLSPTGLVRPEGALLRCDACGQLVSQIAAAAYATSMQAFDDSGFNRPSDAETRRRLRVARRRLRLIARTLGRSPEELALVDVGCSRGDFVAAAARMGFDAQGVEPAASIAAAARDAGREVRSGFLADIGFPDERFDAVTLFEVAEHLAEPQALFREIHRILRPGGVLLFSTGNAASWTVAAIGARWDYFDVAKDAGHVSFFNPQSAALLGERCGFEVIRVRTSRVRLAEREGTPALYYRAAKLAAELLEVPARIAQRGHDMLVLLRKPGTSPDAAAGDSR